MKNSPDKKNRDHQAIPDVYIEAIRNQLIYEAQEAYEQAGIQGLCAEGRWECALDKMRTIKLDESTDEAE